MCEEITHIAISGHRIGIIGLSGVIESVKRLKLGNDAELQRLLLEKIKKQNWIPDSKTTEYSQALLREYKKALGEAVDDEKSVHTAIRILGPGCPACDKMEGDVKTILNELNIAADVQHVRDVNQIAEYGLLRTPSLVINDAVVLNGRSLPLSQLKSLIQKKLNAGEEKDDH
ncbi:MAG: thioredoxin family protein [candidate division KSB1 bacterium]|jgi:small redox-active disulfide protein 2|nr:thioredoxin family protein [candidate division KSB1 bacterium]